MTSTPTRTEWRNSTFAQLVGEYGHEYSSEQLDWDIEFMVWLQFGRQSFLVASEKDLMKDADAREDSEWRFGPCPGHPTPPVVDILESRLLYWHPCKTTLKTPRPRLNQANLKYS